MKRRIAIIICLSVFFGITPSSGAAPGTKPALKIQCPGYREFYPDPEWPNYYQLFKPAVLVKVTSPKLLGEVVQPVSEPVNTPKPLGVGVVLEEILEKAFAKSFGVRATLAVNVSPPIVID